MRGGGPSGWGQPSPSRDLSQLVRKLAALHQQDAAAFSETQRAALLPILAELRDGEKLTDDDAQARDAEIQALLTESQQEALAGIELPRRRRGGQGERGGGGPAPAPSGGNQTSQQPTVDRRQAFRDRILQIPAVKTAYDAKLAQDPTLADDPEKQREFFRGVMREISPFQRGSSKEAVETLIAAFQGKNETTPAE